MAIRPRKGRPVLWWAAFGAAAVALQTYVYVAWIASDDFKRVPTGPDPVPQVEKVFAWILQPLFVLAALAALWWVARGCLRTRSLTFDAKLLIAGYCQVWLDPVGGLIQPQFFFNSYYVNFGTWTEHIPGWIYPNGSLQADLPFVEGALYGCFIAVAVAGCAFMRWIRRRRPQTSNVTLVLCMWAAVAIFVLVFEQIFILRPGVAAWEAVYLPLTVFDGTQYQMSLIPDPIFWGGFITTMICLRFFLTDTGRSVAEAGLDRVAVSDTKRTTISTFAVIGIVSAAMMIASLFAVTASLYSRTAPDLPSYLRHGMCGEGSDLPCPNPGVPIQRPADD